MLAPPPVENTRASDDAVDDYDFVTSEMSIAL
jgi:hypothetical protein